MFLEYVLLHLAVSHVRSPDPKVLPILSGGRMSRASPAGENNLEERGVRHVGPIRITVGMRSSSSSLRYNPLVNVSGTILLAGIWLVWIDVEA